MRYMLSQCSLFWLSTANGQTLIIKSLLYFYLIFNNISSLCETACVQEGKKTITKLPLQLKICSDPTNLTHIGCWPFRNIPLMHRDQQRLTITGTLTLECTHGLGGTWSERGQSRSPSLLSVQQCKKPFSTDQRKITSYSLATSTNEKLLDNCVSFDPQKIS